MVLTIIKLHNTGNVFADTYQLENGSNHEGQYDIRGLIALLESEKAKHITVPPMIRKEVEAYKEYCAERKSIWQGEGSREAKEEKTRRLEDRFGERVRVINAKRQ